MDGTEDDIIWEEEAANDGDSDGDLLYSDSDKELRAVIDEERIGEDFLRFRWKASSKPNGPFQGYKSKGNVYETGMNPFYFFLGTKKSSL